MDDLQPLRNDQDMLLSIDHALTYTLGLLTRMRESYETCTDGRLEMMSAIDVMTQAVDAIQYDVQRHGKHLDAMLTIVADAAAQRGTALTTRDALLSYVHEVEYRAFTAGVLTERTRSLPLPDNTAEHVLDRLTEHLYALGDITSLTHLAQARDLLRRALVLARQLPPTLNA